MDKKAKLLGLLAFLIAVSVGQAATDYNDWFKHFYQTQDIAPFAGFWQMVVNNKMLENPNRANPIIGFSSQVFHQHPELLKDRVDHLASFSAAERASVLKLLWLSDTVAAREILKKEDPAGLFQKIPPPIGTWKIAAGTDLDLCWGWFFATGDVAALDPIIAALDLGRYAGALKRYRTALDPREEDRAEAYQDAIFGAARWSLEANGSNDPLVAKHLGELFNAPQTPKGRNPWLAKILLKIDPDDYGAGAPVGEKAS